MSRSHHRQMSRYDHGRKVTLASWTNDSLASWTSKFTCIENKKIRLHQRRNESFASLTKRVACFVDKKSRLHHGQNESPATLTKSVICFTDEKNRSHHRQKESRHSHHGGKRKEKKVACIMDKTGPERLRFKDSCWGTKINAKRKQDDTSSA